MSFCDKEVSFRIVALWERHRLLTASNCFASRFLGPYIFSDMTENECIHRFGP
jgi:hypothetical protein